VGPVRAYTLGIEEEVHAPRRERDWSLAQRIATSCPRCPRSSDIRVAAETHGSALELRPNPTTGAVRGGAGFPSSARGCSATGAARSADRERRHPPPRSGPRSDRRRRPPPGRLRFDAELARREPTFALPRAIGVGDPRSRSRSLTAAGVTSPVARPAANSPVLAGTRHKVCVREDSDLPGVSPGSAFRVTSPATRYVETVDLLLRCEAFPDRPFLWWDIQAPAQVRHGRVRIWMLRSGLFPMALFALLRPSPPRGSRRATCPRSRSAVPGDARRERSSPRGTGGRPADRWRTGARNPPPPSWRPISWSVRPTPTSSAAAMRWRGCQAQSPERNR